MVSTDDPALGDVEFDELESVDQYEATFTGTLDGSDLTLTYTLETAVDADESATVHTPGDEALEHVVVQPDTFDFQSEARETVRFTATDDDGEELVLVYAFAQAEDADETRVDLAVDASS